MFGEKTTGTKIKAAVDDIWQRHHRGELNHEDILGDTATKTGGDTGSDFWLQAYNDAGGTSFSALYASRATGDVLVDHDPTQPLGVATKQCVDSLVSFATSDMVFNVSTTGDYATGASSHGRMFGAFPLISQLLDWP
jgi:hypothetical protein